MSTKLPNFHRLTPQQRAAYGFPPNRMKQWERADTLRNAGATPEQIAADPEILALYTPEQRALIQQVEASQKAPPTAPPPAAERVRAGSPITCPNCGHSFLPGAAAPSPAGQPAAPSKPAPSPAGQATPVSPPGGQGTPYNPQVPASEAIRQLAAGGPVAPKSKEWAAGSRYRPVAPKRDAQGNTDLTAQSDNALQFLRQMNATDPNAWSADQWADYEAAGRDSGVDDLGGFYRDRDGSIRRRTQTGPRQAAIA